MIRSLKEIQLAQKVWSEYNFGTGSPDRHSLYGVVEELGELFHAILKLEQGIRGTPEVLTEKAKDAVGDLVIFLMDFCNKRGWDFEEIVFSTWHEVSKRDWKKYPKDGISE